MPAIASEWPRLRRPRWTLRLRLTLLYGTMFLVAGAVLLAITYGLVANTQGDTVTVRGQNAVVSGGRQTFIYATSPVVAYLTPPVQHLRLLPPGVRRPSWVGSGPAQVGLADQAQANSQRLTAAQHAQLQTLAGRAQRALSDQRSSQLGALLTTSGIALGIMAFLSIGLGWLMAGRALRPLRTMNSRARGISERNLHQRLAVVGPDDELSELAGTFDGLLARLETAFESQRRFVANASHELRTPITVSRTLVEVALADPTPSVPSLRDTCRRLLVPSEQQERTIEALLTLARSQRGIEGRQRLNLEEIAAEVLRAAPADRVLIETALDSAPALGDVALAERMAANLIDNAIAHNVEGGWVKVTTSSRNGLARLRVANSGPIIPSECVEELFEPFRRLEGQRTANGRGLGLGLSIVAAIASAHGARIWAESRAGGGLVVEVSFPAAAAERVLAPV